MNTFGLFKGAIVTIARKVVDLFYFVVGNVFKSHFKSKTVNVGDLVLSWDRKTLIGVNNRNIETAVIPSSVTRIGYKAFHDCADLTSVTIPSSVTSIGGWAFRCCISLTSINIPSSVTSIGDGAFNHCGSLTSVIIPSSVTSIGNHTFSGCKSITSITIPNSVTSIGRWCFSFCTGLTSITIPSSVTSISIYAFEWCTGLTSITIPHSVTSVSFGAFNQCKGLTSITIHGVKYKTVIGNDGDLCVYDKSYHHTIDHSVMSKIKVYSGTRWFNGVEGGEVKLSSEIVVVCDESSSLYAHANTLEEAIDGLMKMNIKTIYI